MFYFIFNYCSYIFVLIIIILVNTNTLNKAKITAAVNYYIKLKKKKDLRIVRNLLIIFF